MENPVAWKFVSETIPSWKITGNKSDPNVSHTPSLHMCTTKLVLDQRSGPDKPFWSFEWNLWVLFFSSIFPRQAHHHGVSFFPKWQTMVAFQLACRRGSILSESPEPSVLHKYFSEWSLLQLGNFFILLFKDQLHEEKGGVASHWLAHPPSCWN